MILYDLIGSLYRNEVLLFERTVCQQTSGTYEFILPGHDGTYES